MRARKAMRHSLRPRRGGHGPDGRRDYASDTTCRLVGRLALLLDSLPL